METIGYVSRCDTAIDRYSTYAPNAVVSIVLRFGKKLTRVYDCLNML